MPSTSEIIFDTVDENFCLWTVILVFNTITYIHNTVRGYYPRSTISFSHKPLFDEVMVATLVFLWTLWTVARYGPAPFSLYLHQLPRLLRSYDHTDILGVFFMRVLFCIVNLWSWFLNTTSIFEEILNTPKEKVEAKQE